MSEDSKNSVSVTPEKKGNFFSRLLFNDPEAVVDKQVQSNVQQNVQSAPQPQVAYVNSTNTIGVINQDIYNNLKQILNECNLPGPDYLELKTAADAMKAYLPDENQRILVSFASIKATSPKLTKKIVTSSIDEYIKFIEKEKSVAEKESGEAFDSEITARQNKIDSLNGEIEKAKVDIQALSDKIIATSQEINTINGEKLNKQSELEIKKKNFDVTIDAIVNELKSDKLKIETLINE